MSSFLQHSPAHVLQQLLIQGGQASDIPSSGVPTGDWPCYITVEPDSPDEVLTVDDTTGQSDGKDMLGGVLNQHYGFQLRVRSTKATDGWAKAQQVRAWLSESVYQALVAVTLGGTATYSIHCISKLGQVLKLGTDSPSTRRWLHTLNGYISLRQVS